MPTYVLTIDGQAQDLAAKRIVLDRLTVSWRAGRQLVFSQVVRHDQADFQLEDPVVLSVDGTVYFRGAIKSVAHVGEPGAERVTYTADGLRALSRQVTACADTGVPRLVWNAEPDDEDYDPDRTGTTVGEMIKELIDGHAAALQALGVIQGTGYVQAELDELDTVPARVVLRERDLGRAVAELVALQPGYVFQVHPAEQQYRFHAISSLSAVTVTVGGDDRVLRNLLVPDLRSRATAVKIVGGQELTPAVVSVSDGGLTPDWDSDLESGWTIGKALAPADSDDGTVTGYTATTITDSGKSWAVDRWAGGRVVATHSASGTAQTLTVLSNTATTLTLQGSLVIEPDVYEIENGVSDERYVYSRWQIADAAKRQIAPIIPGGQYAPMGWMIFQRTYKPVVCERRTFGGGSGYFYRSAEFEWDAGRFVTAQPLARGRLGDPGAAVGPEDVLLIYACRGENLTARYPASGYAGTAYTEFGLQRERVIHDERFVSADDQARCEAIAEALHRGLGDVVYAGRVPLATLDWSLGHLGKRVNIAGVDRFGDAVTTGWESINALLCEVTFLPAAGRTDLDLTTDTSDWSLPFAELRDRRRTQDRLGDLEAQVTHLRRRVRRSPGAAPPDPDALHRGLTGVESLAVSGGDLRTADVVLAAPDDTIAISNPTAEDPQTFGFSVNASQVDHGALAGLADDDHPQYILADGTRAFTGDQSMGTHKLTDVVDPAADQDAATKHYVDTNFALQDHQHDAYIEKAIVDAKGDLIVATADDTPARFAVGADGTALIADSGEASGVKWGDHGDLAGRGDDDHTIYVKADGTRAFTGVVAGITPTAAAHLTTKQYVDDTAGGVTDHGLLEGLGDDDHTQYTLVAGTRAFTGDQSMGTHKLTSLANAVADTDALPKGQADGLYVLQTIGDNKGDLIGFSADNTPVKIPKAAADGKYLKSKAAGTGGVEWGDAAGGNGLPTPTAAGKLLISNATGWEELDSTNYSIIICDGAGGWEVWQTPNDTQPYMLWFNPDTNGIEWLSIASGEVGYFLPGPALDYDMWLRWWIDDGDEWPAWDYLP